MRGAVWALEAGCLAAYNEILFDAAWVSGLVVTGFLGAGKTTLIRSLLKQANGMRIALIVNEFGDFNASRGFAKTRCQKWVPRGN